MMMVVGGMVGDLMTGDGVMMIMGMMMMVVVVGFSVSQTPLSDQITRNLWQPSSPGDGGDGDENVYL